MTRPRALALLAVLVLAAPGAALAGPPTLRVLPAPPPNVNSFVLTSPQGVKVFLDVVSVPEDLAAAATDPRNLLAVTHRHADHHSDKVDGAFRGGKLVAEAGALRSGDVTVTVIGSSHIDDEIDGHTNTIVVVDLGGVRVAHFGDCGQETLTPEQVKAIGRVDVMISQFENSHADANTYNKKGYKVLAQVSPALVVPTHIQSEGAVKLLGETYRAERTEKMEMTELVLSPALLGKGKRAIFMGGNLPLAKQAGLPVAEDLGPSPTK